MEIETVHFTSLAEPAFVLWTTYVDVNFGVCRFKKNTSSVAVILSKSKQCLFLATFYSFIGNKGLAMVSLET